MTTTWYVCLALVPVAVVVYRFWPRIAPYLQRRPAPVVHVGATENWANKLHAMKDSEVSPELISDVERELAWGLVWHELEHGLQEQIDRIFVPVLAALEEPRTFAELYELVFPEQVNEKTGEWKLVTV